jgi:DNA polymerase-3 subunit delta'
VINPLLQSLMELSRSDRMPQSLLLYGPAPAAVESCARDFLMNLFCQSPASGPDTSGPCGGCCECRSFQIGEHPEVFSLGAAVEDGQPSTESIKIEQVRHAIEHVGWHSAVRADGRKAWRVVWLRQAENLTEQAANALLKTVEEPPEGALILITSRHPRNLLPTLRSRLLALRIPGREPVADLPPAMRAAIAELLRSPLAAASLAPAEQIARQGRMKAGEFAAGTELMLNELYRESFASGRTALLVEKLSSRRITLSRLHQLARRQRIALNTQLAAEMIGAAPGRF